MVLVHHQTGVKITPDLAYSSPALARQIRALCQSALLSHPVCCLHAGLDRSSTPGEKEAAAAGFGGLYSEKPEDDANGLSAMSMNEMMQKMVVQQATTHKQEVI